MRSALQRPMDIFRPVEKPPHCPNRRCRFHAQPDGWRFKRAGFHARKHPPFKVKRFQCLECRRTFSTQTFRLGYWCRRQDLFEPVFLALMSCSGLRQIGRQLSLTRVVVTCRTERLARHCLLLTWLLRPKTLPVEALVLDGFETFEYSQYAPMHLNLLVGARSLLVHGFTEAELRRKGRMTAWQKRRRARLEQRYGRPDPKAIETSVADVLQAFIPPGSSVDLCTDGHPAYGRALRRLANVARIRHRITPSTQKRDGTNPLHAVNVTDLLLRHDSANHKRETIAFSKRRQCVVDRGWIFAVWRNFVKSRSERKQDDPPAVSVGLVPRKPTCDELFARRLFPTLSDLPKCLEPHYWRRIRTRYMARQRTHDLCFAY